MDRATMNRIIDKANRVIDKPRKTKADKIFIIAGVISVAKVKGQGWEFEQLRKFGWAKPMTAEERAKFLALAESLIDS